jgi:butyrate kinase
LNVLAINPGSTSTKTALYSREGELFRKNIHHDSQTLARLGGIPGQLDFRRQAILSALQEVPSFSLRDLAAVVGRGGLLRPIPGGVYRVNERMKEDLRAELYGSHASNLGALIAGQIAGEAGVPAFIVDPVVVDELAPLARYTGLPEIRRRSIFHALNQKATARKAARSLGREYADCNLIVAHLGGGTSIGIHERGRVVDVNNALDGEGPFSIERAGSLPAGDWMRYVLWHSDNPTALQWKLIGQGGVVAYLGTTDAQAIETAIRAYRKGEEAPGGLDGRKCLEIMQALCYRVAREICSLAAVVSGRVDAVVLTGGLANSEGVVEEIRGRVSFLAPVLVYPGENELESLATSVFEALEGRLEVREYTG